MLGVMPWADTVIYNRSLTSARFDINGTVVEGGHLNYIGVGMMAAYAGPEYTTNDALNVMVGAWNLYQIAIGEGMRNLNDIQPGITWMRNGAEQFITLQSGTGLP